MRSQFAGEVTRKCAFRPLIPGYLQGVWEDLGGCLAWLSPPIACDLAPLQTCNPAELAHLMEGCLACSSETQQLLALHWGFPCASWASLQHHQGNMVETGTQTTSGNTVDKIGIQAPTTVIGIAVKKSHWVQRSMGPCHQLVQEQEEE